MIGSNDKTPSTMQVLENHGDMLRTSAIPQLMQGKVTPTTGTNTTSFNFTVKFFDASNDFPSWINVTLNGTGGTHVMAATNPGDINTVDGKQYSCSFTLPWGLYKFRVNCSDGTFTNGTAWINGPSVSPFASPVSGTIKKVAIFEDQLPWGYNVTMPRMVSLGIKYTKFTSASLGLVSLAGYDKVYIESQQPTSFYTALTQPSVRTWLESYVSSGGIFVMNHMHYTSDSISGTLPGSYTEYNSGTGYDNIMINASWSTHPLVTSCTSVGLSNWGASTYQYLLGMTGAEKRIVYDNSIFQPRLFTRVFGNGMLVYDALVVEWAANSGSGTSSAYLSNLITYTPGTVNSVQLISPANNSNVMNGNINFTWSSVKIPFGSVNYTWQLSNRSDFATVTSTVNGILQTPTTTSRVILVNVTTGKYYWRVKPFSGIYSGNWSQPFVLNEIKNDRAPRLTSGMVSPGSGNQFTSFTFSAVYSDQDNNTPSSINVVINGSVRPMVKQNPLASNYVGGVTYQYVTTFAHVTGSYRYYFNCSDGRYANNTLALTGPIMTEINSNIPRLTSAMVSPPTGLNTTTYNFSVRYTDADNNYPASITVTINASTYAMVAAVPLDTNVVDGKTYYYMTTLGVWGTYRFRMNCSDGVLTNGTTWVINPFVNPFLGAPTVTLSSPSNGGSAFNGVITFSWTSSGAFVGGTTYTWQLSNTSSFTKILKQVSGIPAPSGSTSRNIDVQQPTGTYYWRVHPVNGAFNGSWTSIFTLTINFNNNTPQMISPSVNPPTGNQFTIFNFTVNYVDADNNAPTYVRVTINGTVNAMVKAIPADSNYVDGCIYKYTTTLPVGTLPYYFSCFDGRFSNTTGTVSVTVIEINSNAPKILNAKVTPTVGTNTTVYNFTATYQDADNNQPRNMNVTINGTTYTMVKVNPLATNAIAGIQYTYTRTLSWGIYQFQVRCFDGLFTNSTTLINAPVVNPFAGGSNTTIFFDDFESGLGKWSYVGGMWHVTSTQTNIWGDGMPWNPPHSPTHAAWFGQEGTGNYYNSSRAWGNMISQPINLAGVPKSYLEFFHWRDCEGSDNSSNWDRSYVYISTNDGSTWSFLYQYTGDILAWQRVVVNISAFCGYPAVRLKFFFDTLDAGANSYRGWIVDDIKIFTNGTIPIITLLGPTNGATVFNGLINFNWTVSGQYIGGTTYTWQLSNTSNFAAVLNQVTGIPAPMGFTSRVINVQQSTGTYYWRVRPTNGVYSGNWTNPFTINIVFNNNTPQARFANVNPSTGNQFTIFNFTVQYWDADNNAPTYVRVTINGTVYAMVKAIPADNNYVDGCIYQYVTTFAHVTGSYRYYFTCSDGRYVNTTMTYTGPTVTEINILAPRLTNAMVSPTTGLNTTTYNFSVRYTEADNNYPVSITVTINASTFVMVAAVPLDTNVVDGKTYYYTTTLGAWGTYRFRMNCSDGLFTNGTTWVTNPFVNPFYSAPTVTLSSPSNGGSVFNGLITFSWTSSGAFVGGTTYTWQMSNTSGFTRILKQVSGIPAPSGLTSRVIDVQQPTGTYYWRVHPVNGAFNGSWTSTFTMNLVFNNNTPQMILPSVNPPTGNQLTTFNFTVQYWDADNNAPTYVRVTINGTVYAMVKAIPADSNYVDGCIYKYTTTVPLGTIPYYFSCNDGKYSNTTSTYSLTVATLNLNAPKILNAKVTPTFGTNTTVFNFTATYQDADNNLPTYMNITINGTTYNMVKVNPLATNAIAGIQYTYTRTLSWAYYQFKVSCSDGAFSNATSWINAPEVNPFRVAGNVIFYDNFDDGSLGTDWSLSGSGIGGVSSQTYNSPIYSAYYANNAGYVLSRVISLAGYSNVNVSYWVRQGSASFSEEPDPGEDFIVEYYSNTGTWVQLDTFLGSDAGGTIYTRNRLLPANAYHSNFQIRFRQTSGSGAGCDYWHFDDVKISSELKVRLTLPANLSTRFTGNIAFNWTSLSPAFGPITYHWQLASTSTFTTIVDEAWNIAETPTSSSVTRNINVSTGTYYWRVQPIYGIFKGNWSSPFSLNIIKNDHVPMISALQVNPVSGNQLTVFNFTVSFTDLDNNAPVYVNITINGTVHSMVKTNPADVTYTDGCIYKYTTTLPVGIASYYVSCSDGRFTNVTGTLFLTVTEVNNNVPAIINVNVSPTRGSNSTTFNFTATYQDLDNNQPRNMNITINGTTYNMVKIFPSANNAIVGIKYMYLTNVTKLAYGNYTFQVRCFDGKFSNATAIISNPKVGPFYVGVPTITLISPTNGATSFSGMTWFNWTASGAFAGGTTYTWQLSNTTSFTTVLMQVTGIPAPAGLTVRQINVTQPNGAYYWRVRPVNGIFNGNWTSYFTLNLLANNNPPQLKFPGVSPATGNQFTTFNFTVQYWDADNNAPTYVRVTINGTTYSMVKAIPADNTYTDGCIYKYTTTLPIGSSSYSYSTSDGRFSNVTASLSVTVIESNTNVPNILNVKVNPTIGTNTTVFNFTATYQDADNNQPRNMNITINGTTYNMVKIIPSATNAIAGIKYTYVTTLPWGYYIFQVRCYDGKFPNATAWISGLTVTPFSSSSSGAITKVAIFQNVIPWYNASQPIMVAHGISYTQYTSASLGVVSLSPFNKVIIASVQDTTFYTALQAPATITWLQNYVNGGGILEIHGATQGAILTLPFGLGSTYSTTNALTINASYKTNPMVTGYTNAGLANWGSSAHNYITGLTSADARIIYDNASFYPRLVTAYRGNGMLILSGMTLEYAYGIVPQKSKILENIILYSGLTVNQVTLLSPLNNSIVQSGNINFTWTSLSLTSAKVNYTWQLSNTPTFSSILLQAIEIRERKTTSFVVVPVNLPSGLYYWRVKPTFLVFSGNWSLSFRFTLNSSTYPFNIIPSITYRTGNGTYVGGMTIVVRVNYLNPGTTALTGVQTLLSFTGYSYLSSNASASITVPANSVPTFQDFLVFVASSATSQNPVIINATWTGVRQDTGATVSGKAGLNVLNIRVKAQASLQVTRITCITGNGTYIAGMSFIARVEFSNPASNAKAINVSAVLNYGGYSDLSANSSALKIVSGITWIDFNITISTFASSGTVPINAIFVGTEEITNRVLNGMSTSDLTIIIRSQSLIVIESVMVNATQPRPNAWVLVTVRVRNNGGTSVNTGMVLLHFNSTFALTPIPVNSSTGLYIGANGRVDVQIKFQIDAGTINNTFISIDANFTGIESISGRAIIVPCATVNANATIKVVNQPFSVSMSIVGGRLSYIRGIDTFKVRAVIDNNGGSFTVTGTLSLNFLGGAINYNVNTSYTGINLPVNNILIADFLVTVTSTASLGIVDMQAAITSGTNKNSNTVTITTYTPANITISSMTYITGTGTFVGGMSFTIRLVFTNTGASNARGLNLQTVIAFGGFASLSSNATGILTILAGATVNQDFLITIAAGAPSQNPVTISASWTASEQYSGRSLNGDSTGHNVNVIIKARSNLQITGVNYITGNSTYIAGMSFVVRVSLSNPATSAQVLGVMASLSFGGASGLSTNSSAMLTVSGNTHIDFLVRIADGALSQNPVVISANCSGTEEISARSIHVNTGITITIAIKAQATIQITSIVYLNGTGTYVAGMRFLVRVAIAKTSQSAKVLGASVLLNFGGYMYLSCNISATKTIIGNDHFDFLITVLPPVLPNNVVAISAVCSGIEEISSRSLNVASTSSLTVNIVVQPPYVISKPSDISIIRWTPGIYLTWILHGDSAGYYSLTRNGTAIALTKPWTSNITILVDTTVIPGVYVYNLTYADGIGTPGTPSIVRVTILPNQPPYVFTKPSDMSITKGTPGVFLAWILHGDFAGYYTLTRNGTAISINKPWTSNVTILIDTNIAPGIYVYNLTYTDGIGIPGTPSIVRVTILPNQPPQVFSKPSDMSITQGTPNVYLTWILHGDSAGYYTLTRNGTVIAINKPWTSNVTIFIDTNIAPGLYVYNLTFTDGIGLQGPASVVRLTILSKPGAGPTIFEQPWFIIVMIAGIGAVVAIAAAASATKKKKAAKLGTESKMLTKGKAGKQIAQPEWMQPATMRMLTLDEVKQRLKHLFVFHTKSSVCLFYQSFTDLAIDPQLIAGFISAISSFGATFEKEAQLKVLEYQNFKILLQESVVCKYALLFTGDLNPKLNELLNTFVGEFESKFRQQISEFNGNVSMFTMASEIMNSVFKMPVTHENMAMAVETGKTLPQSAVDASVACIKQPEPAAVHMPFNLYCPSCGEWTPKAADVVVTGTERCIRCDLPLQFVPKCDNCGHGFIRPVTEFDAFKNSPRTCEKCGNKMRIQ